MANLPAIVPRTKEYAGASWFNTDVPDVLAVRDGDSALSGSNGQIYINNPDIGGLTRFALDNFPADLKKIDTLVVTVRHRLRMISSADDNYGLDIALTWGPGSALNELIPKTTLVRNMQGSTWTETVLTFPNPPGGLTEWNDARVTLYSYYSQSMGADGGQIAVDYVELSGTYTQARAQLDIPVEDFTENFNAASLNADKWTYEGAPTISNGVLQMDDGGKLTSYDNLAWTSGDALVFRTSPSSPIDARVGWRTADWMHAVYVEPSSTGSGGVHNLVRVVNGSGTTVATYDAGAPTTLWWQIKYDPSGNIVWLSSTDGFTWTQRASVAGAATTFASVGKFYAECIFISGTTADRFGLDNINVLPGIFSDDFEDGTLDPRWIEADPGSIATWTESGGLLSVVTTTGGDAYNAAAANSRMLQAHNDTDFDVAVKWSIPEGSNEGVGLWMDDGTNDEYLRYDIRFDPAGSNAFTFIADRVGGTYTARDNTSLGGMATKFPNGYIWMRLKRVGTTVTCYYRTVDGGAWTQHYSFTSAVNANRVGPHLIATVAAGEDIYQYENLLSAGPAPISGTAALSGVGTLSASGTAAFPPGGTAALSGAGTLSGSGTAWQPAPPQLLRPVADGTIVGSWATNTGATTNLYTAIDEAAPGSTADFVVSPSKPATTDFYRAVFGAATNPVVNTGHVLRIRHGKDATGGIAINANIILRQSDGTQIATRSFTTTQLDTTDRTDTITLTEAEAALITDYSALRIEASPQTSGGGAARLYRLYWVELEVPAKPEWMKEGSGSLSSSGTLTISGGRAAVGQAAMLGGGSLLAGTGTIQAHGSAALSGNGTLTTVSTIAVSGAISLSGEGTLTGSGFMRERREGAGALSGDGTLTLAGVPNVPAGISLTGSGTLAITGAPAFVSTLGLSGAGTLTVAGRPTATGTANLSGAGELATEVTNEFIGSASLAGDGTLAASGKVSVSQSVMLTGAGTLSMTGVPRPISTLALAGQGSLTSGGLPAVARTLALSGAGALATGGGQAVAGAAALAGEGALQTSGVTQIVGTLPLSGAGSLAASATPTVSGAAQLTGDGTLSGTGVAVTTSGILLSGDGQLTALGDRIETAGALTLAGAGALSTVTQLATNGQLSLAGDGALTGYGGATERGSGSAQLSGEGTLTAQTVPRPRATVSLTGTGALSATGRPQVLATVSLSGLGALTVAGTATLPGGTALSGDGDLDATGITAMRDGAHLAGDGTLTVGVLIAFAGQVDLAGSGALVIVGFGGETGAGGMIELTGDGVLFAEGYGEITVVPHHRRIAARITSEAARGELADSGYGEIIDTSAVAVIVSPSIVGIIIDPARGIASYT